MDPSLPDVDKITAPVPTVDVMTEERNRGLDMSQVTHFVVQLTDRRFEYLMQAIAGVSFDYNNPWAFWFFIGKVVSKAFFNDESRLEWFNSVRVRTREFIGFENTVLPHENSSENAQTTLNIVEIDFLRPQARENIKFFWKPARPPIYRSVRMSIGDAPLSKKTPSKGMQSFES